MLTIPCNASTVGKIVDADWLNQAYLKWGWLGSICTYQTLSGAVDAYHFNNNHTQWIKESNYHAWATGQRMMGGIVGYMVYANIKNKQLTWWEKTKRFTGGLLLARNAFEWSYKYNKYGNPFDYKPEHNRHALVYFGIKDGHLTDMYLSTGEVTGPLVDMTFLSVGWLLLK